MAYDSNAILQTQTTVTASANGNSYTLPRAPITPLHVRFLVTDYKSTGTAGVVMTPIIQDSDDGTVWQDIARGTPLTATTAAQTADFDVPFVSRRSRIRTRVEFSTVVGSTPNFNYRAQIGNLRGEF